MALAGAGDVGLAGAGDVALAGAGDVALTRRRVVVVVEPCTELIPPQLDLGLTTYTRIRACVRAHTHIRTQTHSIQRLAAPSCLRICC